MNRNADLSCDERRDRTNVNVRQLPGQINRLPRTDGDADNIPANCGSLQARRLRQLLATAHRTRTGSSQRVTHRHIVGHPGGLGVPPAPLSRHRRRGVNSALAPGEPAFPTGTRWMIRPPSHATSTST